MSLCCCARSSRAKKEKQKRRTILNRRLAALQQVSSSSSSSEERIELEQKNLIRILDEAHGSQSKCTKLHDAILANFKEISLVDAESQEISVVNAKWDHQSNNSVAIAATEDGRVGESLVASNL